ncbi:MAG TPA: chaperone modulator CbpM [Burkholderiaceae bacterium]|nr:chaperone modulator CbpM [Burkholderiaceae bacterium]
MDEGTGGTMVNVLRGAVVEEEIELTLLELCQACGSEREQVVRWVGEGVLEVSGAVPDEWRFRGPALRRARLAASFTRELEVNVPGIALALDLLDEIEDLRSQLQRMRGWR